MENPKRSFIWKTTSDQMSKAGWNLGSTGTSNTCMAHLLLVTFQGHLGPFVALAIFCDCDQMITDRRNILCGYKSERERDRFVVTLYIGNHI